MSNIQPIRKALGLTQVELAGALGVSQSSVSFYEKGATVPPDVAGRLIEFARSRGHVLSFDDIYAVKPQGAGEQIQAAA